MKYALRGKMVLKIEDFSFRYNISTRFGTKAKSSIHSAFYFLLSHDPNQKMPIARVQIANLNWNTPPDSRKKKVWRENCLSVKYKWDVEKKWCERLTWTPGCWPVGVGDGRLFTELILFSIFGSLAKTHL